MAKWGFDENVPRVKPRLRGGLGQNATTTTTETATEPPPVRPHENAEATPATPAPSAETPAPAVESAPEPRRRSLVRDLIQVSDEVAAQEAAKAEASAPVPEPVVEAAPAPVPEPVVEVAPEPVIAPVLEPVVEVAPEPVIAKAPEKQPEPVIEEPPVAPPVAQVEAAPEPEPVVAPEPEPVIAHVAPEPVIAHVEPEPVSVKTPEKQPEPAFVAPATIEAATMSDAETHARRSALKRRAAGLSALPEPPPPAPLPTLDDLDAVDTAAELAAELERALTQAAEANELLRRDLSQALDDLARATAENKRSAEKVEKLEGEARDRSKVVQDLVRELELLEGERDGALTQASDAALATEELNERLALTERRIHELERTLQDAHARMKRFEEAAATHAAQRAALRAELEAVRRERDSLLGKNAELERERDDLGRSRKALDEVHRALSDARLRAQRIRSR